MSEALLEALIPLPAAERLAGFRKAISGRLVFTSSLGPEDQVITHLIAAQRLDIDIITLDTGRIFEESYTLWAETEQRYGVQIKAVAPERAALEELVAAQGPNGFYTSIDARKNCCHVRKVEPLNRALKGASGWITGLRASQSAARGDATLSSRDAARNLLKFNPLFDWTLDQTLAFAKANHVPLNTLHAKGFSSIGCAPCTRAVMSGEPERAGRWWWENETPHIGDNIIARGKECGLHVAADGRLSRINRERSAAS